MSFQGPPTKRQKINDFYRRVSQPIFSDGTGRVSPTTLRRLSLTSTSNTDTITVVSRDVKSDFIGLAISKFEIINVNSFQNKHLLINRGLSKITLCSNDSLSMS